MPTVIEVSGSDKASSLKEDAISEQESIIKERNELQLKAHKMRSAIDLLTEQLETTGQQVTYLHKRLVRIESSNLLLLDGIKRAVDESPASDEEFSDWQEDQYNRIRKHLQQLIKQAEATLLSNGLDGTEDSLTTDINDHTCNSLLVTDSADHPGQENIARQFNELMKVVDENGESVCALCHAKPKKEPRNYVHKIATKLGISNDIVIAICKMLPYLARHTFSAFTVLTALIPAVRAIAGRRNRDKLPKVRVPTATRTKKAIISEVVYFAIMVITYTREIFGSDGALSSVVTRGKELWQIMTTDSPEDTIDDTPSDERRKRMLCSFGNIVNKMYAFIESNERNEKNVKKVVSNTVKVESLVGKLTQASTMRGSPLMRITTLLIYSAGIVGAWEVSKRAGPSV